MFDFILFYSKYSPVSCQLLEEFPMLSEKSVSVDSTPIRKILKKFSIISVPTLILILNNKIVDRVIGYESISDWLHLYVYRVNHLTTNSPGVDSLDSQEFQIDNDSMDNIGTVTGESVGVENTETTISLNDGKTNLDDLTLEDESDVHITKSTPVNLLKMAEDMKKERDNNEPFKKRI